MSAKWWAVYRGGQYIEHVWAVSGERALDVVAERARLPLEELTVYLDDPRGINPLATLGMLPYFSQEIGPEFSETGPTMQAVPWAQTEARVSAQREPGPAAPGKEVV